jgi:hypothetical protein
VLLRGKTVSDHLELVDLIVLSGRFVSQFQELLVELALLVLTFRNLSLLLTSQFSDNS